MFGGEVRCPLVIRTPNGAGNQLTAQHSQSFEGWFAATPGLKVVAPANPADAKGLLKAAIRDDDPVLVVENLVIYKERGAVPLDLDFVTPIGRAAVARGGSDVTLVAHGYSVVRALHVADRLAASHDVDAEVVDLRSLRPLDVETVAVSVAKTSRVVCVEEGWPTTTHLTDPYLFFGAANDQEIGENVRIMLDSMKVFADASTLRTFTMSEFLLK